MSNKALLILCVLFLFALITEGQHSNDPEWATLTEVDDSCLTALNTGVIGVYGPWVTAGLLSSSDGMKVDLSDPLGDSVTITTSGHYSLGFAASFHGTPNSDVSIGILINRSITVTRVHSTTSASSSISSVSAASPVVKMASSDVVHLGFDSDTLNDDVMLCHVDFSVKRID